jgi:hypothetical protein
VDDDRLERFEQLAPQRLGRLAQHPLVREQPLGPAPQPEAPPPERLKTAFHAVGRGQAREEDAARLQHTPHLPEHRPPVRLVPREVEHGAAEHRVEALTLEGHPLDRLPAEVIFGELRGERAGERTDTRHRVGREVDAADVITLAQEVDEVASRPAAGVENPHRQVKAPPEELVEEVDVDAAELFL